MERMRIKLMSLRTRKKPVGREPVLRDSILQLLVDSGGPMTARDVADVLGINKTTPFRPLNDLENEGLIKKELGVDGAQYIADLDAIEIFKKIPRRVRE